jgi:GNAT superfamily N-acetyltransferase
MKYEFRKYKSFDDFLRIRELLITSYKIFGKPYNWTIERWNYIHFFGNIINGLTDDELSSRIGIWEDEYGEILGVVNSECDKRGEVFFQIGSEEISDDCLEDMFEFAENKLSLKRNDKKIIQLRIPKDDRKREEIAIKRGYKKIDVYESMSEYKIDGFQDLNIPEGYKIKTGTEVNILEKGYAHAKAFGYNREDMVKINPYAYQSLKKSFDYRQDLDIYIISNNKEIISFCTIWYDRMNRIGILEPVGTIPEYRKRGFGKMVINEAINRIYKEGANKAYVVSRNEFYDKIGFEEKYTNYIWEKEIVN